jgi:adenosylcobyric acid synthase
MSDSNHSPWNALAGVEVSGYEIHHGQTSQHDGLASKGIHALSVMPQGLAWRNQEGNVLGIYLHGLFEDTKVLQALFGNGDTRPVPTLDVVFDGLSDFIEKHFSPGLLDSLIR